MNRGIRLALALVAVLILAACGGSQGQVGEEQAPEPQNGTAVTAFGEEPVTQASTILLGSSGSKPGVPASSRAPDDSRLRVKFEGIDGPSIPLRNGGQVNLGDGLVAEIFVDPYPTDKLTAWVDLYLGTESGQSINDAHTLILYDMWSMSHGPYTGLSDAATDGHYVFKLEYIMFGAWEQVFEVRLPGSDKVYKLVLVIVAMPS